MKIICTGCNTSYNVPDEKLPLKEAKAKCKKCGGEIKVPSKKSIQQENASVAPQSNESPIQAKKTTQTYQSEEQV